MSSQDEIVRQDRYEPKGIRWEDYQTTEARTLVKRLLVPREGELHEERRPLITKAILAEDTMTLEDEARLCFIHFQLDLIEDAIYGPGLDEMTHQVDALEQLVQEVERARSSMADASA